MPVGIPANPVAAFRLPRDGAPPVSGRV